MMKWVIRGLLAVGVIAVLGTVSSYLFVDRELNRMYGAFVDVAEPELEAEAAETYALANVNVLAPKADRFIPGQSVIVEDGLIRTVGAGDVPEGIRAVDGQGMYLVPGFTDSHVHLWESANDLLLYVANGVTQVREMNGQPNNLAWKREIEEGRIGPEIFVVAPQFATFVGFEGVMVGWTQRKTIVRNRKDVERAVAAFKAAGYDALKSSSFLSRENYDQLSEVAAEAGMPLVGHIPVATDLDAVWRGNASEIAHIEELVKQLDKEFGGYGPDEAGAFLEFVRERSDDVAQNLVREGIMVTSTLDLVDSFHRQKSQLKEELQAAELEYENPGIAEGTVIASRGMGWLPEVNIYRWPEGMDERRQARSLIYWKAYAEAQHILLDAMLAHGVDILAGTDANVPVMVPGFSLHDELQAMNAAGMSSSEVLASATVKPAAFMASNTGEISAGRKAHLVLLRDNPLEDISATREIEMVMLGTRVFDRADLDAMLQSVADANAASRKVALAAE